jgi:hypothetical protein
MFTKRHEQELDEIKALTYELRDRVHTGLERVKSLDTELTPGVESPDTELTPRVESPDTELTPPLVAFVHIPKTGGSTVTLMLMRAYSKPMVHDAGNCFRGQIEKTERKIARPKVAKARATAGHIPYGLYRKYLPAGTRYVTILREPVGRVISHWYRHRRRTGTRHDAARPWLTNSIEEALSIGMPEVNNVATRLLCGAETPYGELPADALEQAKANLREFAFVGIQERFDESLALLERTIGLEELVPYGEPQRVTRHRGARDQFTDEQRALVAEHNRLDAELYVFAKGLFEEAAAAADGALAADVEELRDLNAAVAEDDEAANERATEWLDRELPPGTEKRARAIREAADAAGIPNRALGRAVKRVGVRKGERDPEGRRIWVRE